MVWFQQPLDNEVQPGSHPEIASEQVKKEKRRQELHARARELLNQARNKKSTKAFTSSSSATAKGTILLRDENKHRI